MLNTPDYQILLTKRPLYSSEAIPQYAIASLRKVAATSNTAFLFPISASMVLKWWQSHRSFQLMHMTLKPLERNCRSSGCSCGTGTCLPLNTQKENMDRQASTAHVHLCHFHMICGCASFHLGACLFYVLLHFTSLTKPSTFN